MPAGSTYSTYKQLIGDVVNDVHELGVFMHDNRNEQQLIRWINEAMQNITSSVDVVKQGTIALDTTNTEYEVTGSGGTVGTTYIVATEIKDVTHIHRTWGNYIRPVDFINLETLLRIVERDSYSNTVYSDSDAPKYATIYIDSSGNTVLRVYPVAQSTQTLTLYYKMLVDPRVRNTSAITASIPLPSIYDRAIKMWCSAQVYANILKQPQFAGFKMQEFKEELDRLARSTATKKIQQNITYF
jgi:hypothetical protein